MIALRAGVVMVALVAGGSAGFAQLPAGTQDASGTTSAAAAASNEDSARLNQVNDALEKGDLAGAVALLTRLTGEEAHKGDPHLWFDLGYAQEGLTRAADAETAYRKAVELDAKYFEAHLALGLLLAREDKLSDARAEIVAALALPEDNKAFVARGYRALAHIDLGTNAADARDELLAALKLTPETPDDALLAAETAERLEDPTAAEAAYRRVLKADPKNVEAIAGLAHSLVKEHNTAATDAAKASEAKAAKPDAPKAADGKSDGKPDAKPDAKDDGNIEEAEKLLTEALAAHPGDAALTAQLAAIYAGDSDPARSAQAVPLVEELHRKTPGDANVIRLLARLYDRAGEPEKALPLYEALVTAAGPRDAGLLNDLGTTQMHLRRFAQSEETLKRAVADPGAFRSPDDLADAYSDLALAANENNDPQEVLLILELRSKIAASTAGSLFLQATSYDKLHQVKQATAAYREFLTTANGRFPDQEWQARHRLITLEHMK